ncbi:hypothetical protein QYE76_009034 [Lolium multiflorum]|uniref:Uncharacterized protein n=1 Tax=Lolium multiflorum TaxID=4521 RepID=A0AAD8TUF5_LOLMU|nr:hypothetical protein QYE76_009034 [Lolium multiflorum]
MSCLRLLHHSSSATSTLLPSRFWSPHAAFAEATERVRTGTLSPKDAHHLFDELLRQATLVPERSLNGFLTTHNRAPPYDVCRSGRTLAVALFNRVRREDAGPQVASPTVCTYSILLD